MIKNAKSVIIIIIFVLVLISTTLFFLDMQKKENYAKELLKYDEVDIFLEDFEISALLIDGDSLYVGGSTGVFLFDSITMKVKKTISKDLELVYSSAMYKDNNRLWIAHDQGIAYYEDGILINLTYPDIPKGRCNTITSYNGAILAGFETGSIIINKENIEFRGIEEGLAEDYVNIVAKDEFDNLWYGAYLRDKRGGLSILVDKDFKLISLDEGLVHKYVTSILPISDYGTLVGCGHLDAGGMSVFKYNDTIPYVFKNYTIKDGLPGPKIRSLYQDKSGFLWITSEMDGLLVTDIDKVFKGESLTGLYIDREQGLSSKEIKMIVENEKYLFLGGKTGLTRIEKALFYRRLSIK